MAKPSVGFDLHWLRSLTLKPRPIWCLQRRACHLSWNFNKENGPPFPGSGSFRVIWPLHFTENRPPPGPEALTHNLTSLSQPQTFLPTWCLELVCVCVCVCTRAHMLAQLCATLCNPMDYNLPDSFVYCHFLLQEISTQGSNTRLQSLLHWQTNSSLLYHLGSPILEG